EVDYEEKIKTQQKNWIGRSFGASVDFTIADEDYKLRVYTTRPDTIFGATYMVIAPEHPIIEDLKEKITNEDAIHAYQEEARKKSDFERGELSKEKTGVKIEGIKAINPLTGKEIPIWISDYVLMSYGTGAIMAVPGHDTRDFEFAQKFDMPIIPVVDTGDEELPITSIDKGIMINSEFLNGLSVKDAKKKIIEYLEEK